MDDVEVVFNHLLLLHDVLQQIIIENRVADPDPDWIRIQSGYWIRIRNPDPGGQKLPIKVEIFLKFMF